MVDFALNQLLTSPQPQNNNDFWLTAHTSSLQQHLLRTGNSPQSPGFASASVDNFSRPSADSQPEPIIVEPPEPFSETATLGAAVESEDKTTIMAFQSRVTPDQTLLALEAWEKAAPGWPDTMPIDTFFDDYGVGSFHHYVNRRGLNPKGRRFVANQKLQQTRQQQPVIHCSLVDALERWGRLSFAERNLKTVKYFFTACGIESSSISLYASVKAGITEKGQALIDAERAPVVPEEETNALRLASALSCLLQYAECRELHVYDFATATGISYPMLRKCWIARCELSGFGMKLFNKYKSLFSALHQWKNASQEQRARWTLNRFALSHRIRSLTWHRCACVQGNDGLTRIGEALYNVPRPEALRQKVIEFLQRREGGEAVLTMSGLLLSEALPVTSEAEKRDEESAMIPLVTVKKEPDSPVTGESCWEPPNKRLHLAIRENGPLLADVHDPTRSITAEVFSHRPLELSYAHELDVSLKKMTPRFQKQFLQKARRFAAWLIATDGREQQKYFKRYINPPQLRFIPDPQQPDAEIPAPECLGLTARNRTKPFTILGGYNAVLLESDADIRYEQRKIGAGRSLAYSWSAPRDTSQGSNSQEVVLSAFLNPNLLALMNTREMAGFPPLSEPGNNVSVIFVNNRYLLYVTINEVARGGQFLVPYGGRYNPLAVKQESLAYDDEAAIVRHYHQPLIVQDSNGNELRGYNAAGEHCPQQPLLRRTMILRQRHDPSGNIWYDAVDREGLRVAISPDNSDNIWHALACALAPKAPAHRIADQIAEFKRIVAQERRQA